MNWIEKTLEELEELWNVPSLMDEPKRDFIKKKLLESYKNGAQAERRKASKEKPEASAGNDA